MRERALIARLLAPVASHPAARGLRDDAAVLTPPLGRDLVLTHDVLAAGVHFIGDEPPGDVARKLVAVNLSDLAAMGARPLGVLLALGLSGAEDEPWLRAFVDGLGVACAQWGAPLLGGDTVRGLERAVLGLTALGSVEPGMALGRAGAVAGDRLWVSGAIGDAALGLVVARGGLAHADASVRAALLERYRRPEPRLALGAALAGVATACLDVSDGLLIDAERLAAASGVALLVELARVPLSRAAATVGADVPALAAGGDDYELLFTAPEAADAAVHAAARRADARVTPIGRAGPGGGLSVLDVDGTPMTSPRLGWEH